MNNYNDLITFNFGKRTFSVMKNNDSVVYFENANGEFIKPITSFNLYDNEGKSLTLVNQHFFMNELINRVNVAGKKGFLVSDKDITDYLNKVKVDAESNTNLKQLFKGSKMTEINEENFEKNKREITAYLDDFKYDNFNDYDNVSVFSGSLSKNDNNADNFSIEKSQMDQPAVENNQFDFSTHKFDQVSNEKNSDKNDLNNILEKINSNASNNSVENNGNLSNTQVTPQTSIDFNTNNFNDTKTTVDFTTPNFGNVQEPMNFDTNNFNQPEPTVDFTTPNFGNVQEPMNFDTNNFNQQEPTVDFTTPNYGSVQEPMNFDTNSFNQPQEQTNMQSFESVQQSSNDWGFNTTSLQQEPVQPQVNETVVNNQEVLNTPVQQPTSNMSYIDQVKSRLQNSGVSNNLPNNEVSVDNNINPINNTVQEYGKDRTENTIIQDKIDLPEIGVDTKEEEKDTKKEKKSKKKGNVGLILFIIFLVLVLVGFGFYLYNVVF